MDANIASTTQSLRLPLTLWAAIGSALTAGIFFTFSTFVMRALALQPPAAGIAAMQSVNVTVINPWFMAAFFGPGVAGIAIALLHLQHWDRAGVYGAIATALYLVGTVGVTFFGNVPLNDALAAVSPDSVAGAELWTKYLSEWTFWNHVRTVAALLASAVFTRLL